MTTDPSTLAFRADAFVQAGRPQLAIEQLGEALARYPDSPELLNSLAFALERCERFSEAAEAARSSLSANPEQVFPLNLLARDANRNANVRYARALTRRVLQIDPDNAEAHLRLATSAMGYVSKSARDNARRSYRRALESRAQDPDYLTVAAQIEDSFGAIDERDQLIAAALAADPSSARALRAKASFSDDLRTKTGILGGVLAADPGDAEARATVNADWSAARRLALTPLWILALGTAFVCVLAKGPWTIMLLVPLWAYAVWTWNTFRKARRAFPRPFRRERLASLPGGRFVPAACWTSVAASALGGILLAARLPLGGWLLIIAGLCWAAVGSSCFADDVRESPDGYAALLQPPVAGWPAIHHSTAAFAVEHWWRSGWLLVRLVPVVLIGVLCTLTISFSQAAGPTILVLCGIIVGCLTAQAAAVWRPVRYLPREPFWMGVRIGASALLAVSLLLGGTVQLIMVGFGVLPASTVPEPAHEREEREGTIPATPQSPVIPPTPATPEDAP